MAVQVHKSGADGHSVNIYKMIGIIAQPAQCSYASILDAHVSAIWSCSVPGTDKPVLNDGIKGLGGAKDRRSREPSCGCYKPGTAQDAFFEKRPTGNIGFHNVELC